MTSNLSKSLLDLACADNYGTKAELSPTHTHNVFNPHPPPESSFSLSHSPTLLLDSKTPSSQPQTHSSTPKQPRRTFLPPSPLKVGGEQLKAERRYARRGCTPRAVQKLLRRSAISKGVSVACSAVQGVASEVGITRPLFEPQFCSAMMIARRRIEPQFYYYYHSITITVRAGLANHDLRRAQAVVQRLELPVRVAISISNMPGRACTGEQRRTEAEMFASVRSLAGVRSTHKTAAV